MGQSGLLKIELGGVEGKQANLWRVKCSPPLPATSPGHTMSDDDNVKVAVRVRPFNKREKEFGATRVVVYQVVQ